MSADAGASGTGATVGVSPARSLLDDAERRRELEARLWWPHAAAAALVVGLVAFVLVPWWAALVAGVIAIVVVGWLLGDAGRNRDDVGRVIGGRSVADDEVPRLSNLVEGLGFSTGVARPELRVLDDPTINMAVFGPAGGGVIVVTQGLLDHLDRVETEAVVAAALTRLKSNDASLGTAAARLVCGALLRRVPEPGAEAPGSGAPESRRARWMATILGEQRAFLGDLAAVDVTRYPPAMADVLDKMERIGTTVGTATVGTAHLWFANPFGVGDGLVHIGFGDPTPLSQRSSLMAEL
ncbi:MAG: hypothetical protein R2698_13655 [Microthrixaceae bacterium]